MRKPGLGDLIGMVIIATIAAVLLVLVSPNLSRLFTGFSRIEDVPASEVKTRLSGLQVRGWVDAPDYNRAEFGEAWADEDFNGCDTRNDVLARDMASLEFLDAPHNCVVQSGVLRDPYTSHVIQFERGADTSAVVQIDHVVALANAWYSGAWQWDRPTRQRFANDHRNLLAVSGDANQDKGHLSADQWLPENKDYHCAFVARQVWVKSKWGLSVTEAERQAMINVLAKCPVIEIGR
ncbi:MAG: HNH endonuclease family protein [Actinomycetaceae bacterium]|nr:HNH endonuclease family protein [Actinomycetaceae bacterium]